MSIHGKLSLPEDSPPFNLTSTQIIPYYQCDKCLKQNMDNHFAYQRVILDGKWYFFNWGKWNFLKEEEAFNPSRRN
jgi:hypothetical protein